MYSHDGSLRFTAQTPRAGDQFDDSELIRKGYRRTIFDYELADGTLAYQQNRYDPPEGRRGSDAAKKKFLPCRPVDSSFDRERNIGKRIFGPGDRRVIYNWPAIMRAGPGSTVFVTEGEKNAADLIKAGLLATTVISHKWTDECVAALTGYELVILEDNDEDGRKLATEAQALLSKVAKSIRVVPCSHLWKCLDSARAGEEPGVNADVSDWIYYGGDPVKLTDICRQVPAEGALAAVPHDFPPEQSIPLWEFILGKHLLRKTVSATAAMGGVGKSTLSITECLAIASGKPLLKSSTARPLRVCLINLEDNRDALDKRIAAAMKHHRLTVADINGRLFTKAKGEIKFKIAKQSRNSFVVRNDAFINGVVSFLLEKQIDVLSIDPFIATHSVNENDNTAIRDVIECYDEIAERANCAVSLWHHTRKGNGLSASVDAARGAGAFVDACRSVRILETMTKEEAARLELTGAYFRSFSGKLNFAPPLDQSDWFRIASVKIDNGGVLFGDDVGVVETWQHPGVRKVLLAPHIIEKIMEVVGQNRWRENVRAAMWVGKAIGPVLGLDADTDRDPIKKAIKKLMEIGALKTQVENDSKRESRLFVVVGNWRRPSPELGQAESSED